MIILPVCSMRLIVSLIGSVTGVAAAAGGGGVTGLVVLHAVSL